MNPIETNDNQSALDVGYFPINITWESQFGGLKNKDDYRSALDCSQEPKYNWFAIGTYRHYGNQTFPSYASNTAQKVILYIRIPDNISKSNAIFSLP